MILNKTKCLFAALFCLSLATLVGCDDYEGDQHVPAFLSLDAINVANDPANSWSTESGFFSSDITAAQVVLWQKGDAAESVVGVFQLPFTVPVLKQGTIDRITIYPVVNQNGIASTRIYYPYYKEINLSNMSLTPGDTLSLDTLVTYYKSRSAVKVPWQEYFEPGQSSIKLSSQVQRLSYADDTVCSGHGCGVIRVTPDQKRIAFWAKDSFRVADPSAYVYLEMDAWSDFNFWVGFSNPTMLGGTSIDTSAVTFNPSTGWKKTYVNLGRLWSWYNHYPDLKLYFVVYNPFGKEGNVFIDNMKVVVL